MLRILSSLICIQLCVTFVSAAAAGAGAPQQEQPKPAAKAAPQKKPAHAGQRAMPMKPQAASEEEDISKIAPPPGPMRLLFHSLIETRIRAEEGVEGVPPSTLRLTATVTGERLGEIVGVGGLVIEDMVDDTGKVLAKPEDVTDLDRTATQPVRVSARLLERGGFQRTKEIQAISNRDAHKLSRAAGWVNIVYGGKIEEVLVDNPLQYTGGMIVNDRLKELGIEIQVVKLGPEALTDDKLGDGVGLRFVSSRKQIRTVEFYDAWMRPVHPREREVTPKDGEPYAYFPFSVGQADADTQMILKVYDHVEVDKLRYEFKDIELP